MPDLQGVNRQFRSLVLLASLTAIATGCGGPQSEDSEALSGLPYVEETSSVELASAAPSDLTPEELSLVEFEADWVCELQRTTFESNDAISDALDQRLADFGIDEETYGVFREQANQDEGIRAAILSTYRSDCVLDGS